MVRSSLYNKIVANNLEWKSRVNLLFHKSNTNAGKIIKITFLSYLEVNQRPDTIWGTYNEEKSFNFSKNTLCYF